MNNVGGGAAKFVAQCAPLGDIGARRKREGVDPRAVRRESQHKRMSGSFGTHEGEHAHVEADATLFCRECPHDALEAAFARWRQHVQNGTSAKVHGDEQRIGRDAGG